MNRVCCSLLAASLFAVGCTSTDKRPTDSLKQTVSAKPSSEVPAELQRLLPKEQLNEKNARAQAKLLENTLRREGGPLERTESARNDK